MQGSIRVLNLELARCTYGPDGLPLASSHAAICAMNTCRPQAICQKHDLAIKSNDGLPLLVETLRSAAPFPERVDEVAVQGASEVAVGH